MQLTTCSWQKKQVQRQMHLKALLLSSFALAIVPSFLFPLYLSFPLFTFHCFLLPVVSPLSFLISDICSSIFFFALVLVLVLCSFFPLSTFFFPLTTFHCTYPFHFSLSTYLCKSVSQCGQGFILRNIVRDLHFKALDKA